MRTALSFVVCGLVGALPGSAVGAQVARSDDAPTHGEPTLVRTYVPQPHPLRANARCAASEQRLIGVQCFRADVRVLECRARAVGADGWTWMTVWLTGDHMPTTVSRDGTCRDGSLVRTLPFRVASGGKAYRWQTAWCYEGERTIFSESGQLLSCTLAQPLQDLAPDRRSCPEWSRVWFTSDGIAQVCRGYRSQAATWSSDSVDIERFRRRFWSRGTVLAP